MLFIKFSWASSSGKSRSAFSASGCPRLARLSSWFCDEFGLTFSVFVPKLASLELLSDVEMALPFGLRLLASRSSFDWFRTGCYRCGPLDPNAKFWTETPDCELPVLGAWPCPLPF